MNSSSPLTTTRVTLRRLTQVNAPSCARSHTVPMKRSTLIPLAALASLAASSLLRAQDKSVSTPDTTAGDTNVVTVDNNFFTREFVDAFRHGKFDFNARLRYEYAHQYNLESSYEVSIRPRFGFTTAPLYGFQGMIEGQNVSLLSPSSAFNAAGSNGQPQKTVIPDPPETSISQVWLSYSNFNSTVKGGNQHYVLDNQRFIGDSGWRQTWQTFNAATLDSRPIDHLALHYGYIWYVNRVYANVDNLPPANQNFHSDSQIINASWDGWQFGTFKAYSYLLAFANSPVNSSATFGGSFAGSHSFDKEANLNVSYRAEYAYQQDYRNQPISYHANYYTAELGGDYERFNLTGGYEVLGSDDGTKGFSTPLATLHSFNGWADVFLTTPNAGLRDLYGSAGVNIPGNIPFRFVYHKFNADSGSTDFGQEFDAIASRKFGKNWTILFEYAYYLAQNPAPPSQTVAANLQKFWAQLEFNF